MPCCEWPTPALGSSAEMAAGAYAKLAGAADLKLAGADDVLELATHAEEPATRWRSTRDCAAWRWQCVGV